jgi:hypothetical protein
MRDCRDNDIETISRDDDEIIRDVRDFAKLSVSNGWFHWSSSFALITQYNC